MSANHPPTDVDYRLEIATEGHDSLLGIQPPVGPEFREQMYTVLDKLGLIRELVIRGGNFFEIKHAVDGSSYSELRVATTALSVAGVRIIQLASDSKNVITEQGKTAAVTPFLKSGAHQLFDGRQ
jgi:hypothetical protein